MNMIPVSERQKPISLANLLHRTTSRILQSLTLQDILTATAAEVRAFLATDRVMIYQFRADGSGQVIAESIQGQRLPSLLGLNFPADDIPAYARELFARSRVRSVVDVSKQQIGQSFVRHAETGEIIPDNMQYRTVEPCHVEYLTAMGVQSSLAIPILHEQQLWGLLVSHHSEARSTSAADLQAVQMVVDQLAVAIAQSLLLEQTQDKARRETAINRIATLLRSHPKIDLQPALAETVSALQGIGGRLYVTATAFELQTSSTGHLVQFQETNATGQLYTCGIQPEWSEQAMATTIEQSPDWQTAFQAHHPTVWAISDIQHRTDLQWLQPACQTANIRSILLIPLEYGQRRLGYLTIFRSATTIETVWAGQFNPDQRQIRARQSFTAWKEAKLDQIVDWRSPEIELAQALASHFAAAILHTQIHGQLELINANLEQQVQERTVQLQQTAEQQQALLEVVTKIRSSLTPATLFRTTAQEVCQLLRTERVAVYRFNPDWGGEFIHDFESTTPEWQGVLKLGENLVWNDTYLQVTQGGRYRHNETFAVDDVTQAGLYQCHVDILKQFHIQAFAIAPIFVGQELWGLLAAYQHSTPRTWDPSEVKFLAQTAAQLGMALQQAELLAHTRQQAEDLAETVEELRRTQTQLIQTEKISSLGQLVAGVAHEINNPVNFIYGNLSHAHEYAEDLLNLLQTYQEDYPHPSAKVQAQTSAIDLEFIAEDLPKLLGSMKVGADRIRQIVLSLLNFSRLDQAEKKPVNIHEGIESTLLILQHRLKARPEHPGIEVIKHYETLPLVECYAGQLNQVFMNILSNAIDAIEQARPSTTNAQPSQITISTKSGHSLDRASIEIHIADNGPGIPDVVRTRIFDPFFTTKPIGKGTGLGLSISHQIVVEKHHGTLTCLSQPGQGTEFVIEIPLR